MKYRSFLLALVVAGCSSEAPPDAAPPDAQESDFTSDAATLLDFDFDGELATKGTPTAASLKGLVRSQMMFTVGHLNADNSVARLNRLVVTNLTTAPLPGGLTRVRYHAKLPVAWGSKNNLPTSYALTLPRRVDAEGQQAFFSAHSAACSDEPDSATPGNLWYHYRPNLAGCSLPDAEVLKATATLKVSPSNTTTKYPEYHRIWEDNALNVVAVFGKYEEGAQGNDDAGVEAYNRFLGALRQALPNNATTPAALGDLPGVAHPDVTVEATLPDGRLVSVTALLVDRVSTAPASFDTRYAELTPAADLVVYNGHAGLGSNVAALTKKGRYFPGKYQIFFLNGCDTFAYQDETLAQARATLNPDDPGGTRYMDLLANAMPAYFSSLPGATMALLNALMNPAQPKGYIGMFKGIDPSQVVVATGEEDNVFSPSFNPGARWAGQDESGTVSYKETKSYQTAPLPPGKYVFELSPEPGTPGGDADLRVRVGAQPTPDKTYKCPSYLYNSNERCVVTVTKTSPIFFTVTGDKSTMSSPYLLRAFQGF